MSWIGEKQKLIGVINLNMFSGSFTADQQRSLIWEGIVFVATTDLFDGKIHVTASLHVPERYGADPLHGVRMQASLPGQFGAGLMDLVHGSASTYRIVFAIDREAAIKYGLF